MSARVPKACSDFAVGFESINNLGSNLEELKEAFEAQHTAPTVESRPVLYPVGSALSFETAPGGAHDSNLIARGIAYVLPTSAADSTRFSREVSLQWSIGVLGGFRVLGVGRYFFPVPGFFEVWGEVGVITPDPDSAATSCFATVTNGDGGILVQTFELGAATSTASITMTGDFLNHTATGFWLIACGARTPRFNPQLGFPWAQLPQDIPADDASTVDGWPPFKKT